MEKAPAPKALQSSTESAPRGNLRVIKGGGSENGVRGPGISLESSRRDVKNDNERKRELKPAGERTPQEQAFLLNARKLQREGLTAAMQENQAEQGAFQSLIDRSGAYLSHEEGALDEMMRKLESLKQQKAKNDSSFFRRVLARGVGTDRSMDAEAQSLETAIQAKQEMITLARRELRQMLKQKREIDTKQTGWQEQASALDQEIEEETPVELPSELLETDFESMSDEELSTEQSGLKAEERILQEEVKAYQREQAEKNMVANELFDELSTLSPKMGAFNQKLSKIGAQYNQREGQLATLREQYEAVSGSAWSRFRNQASLKSMQEAMTILQGSLDELSKQFAETQQQILEAYNDPALEIKQHKKAELDEEINSLSKKIFSLEDRLQKNRSEQDEIAQQVSRRAPLATRRASSASPRRRAPQSNAGTQRLAA